MTRVDFYVTRGAGHEAQLNVAARLAEKAWGRGHRLFIHVSDEQSARQLDDMLWSFRAGSFLPHALATDDLAEGIVIGWGQEPGEHNDVLINLSGEAPAFFSRFQRVAEIVTDEPEHRERQRAAWRFYKERGYPVHKHDL